MTTINQVKNSRGYSSRNNQTLSVIELQNILKMYNLNYNGNKNQLIDRIIHNENIIFNNENNEKNNSNYVYNLPERHSDSYFSVKTSSNDLLDISETDFNLLKDNSEIIKMHEVFDDFYENKIINIECPQCTNKSFSLYLKYLKDRKLTKSQIKLTKSQIKLTKSQRDSLIHIARFVFDEKTTAEIELLPYYNPRKYNYTVPDLNIIIKYKNFDNDTHREDFIFETDNPIFIIQNIKDNKTEILMKSIKSGSVKTVKYLIENGLSVNCTDKRGYKPIIMASVFGNVEIMDYLFSKGANIEEHEVFCKHTPLICAARYLHIEIIKYLLEKGADVNFRDINDLSAIQQIQILLLTDKTPYNQKQYQIIKKLLLKYGAKESDLEELERRLTIIDNIPLIGPR